MYLNQGDVHAFLMTLMIVLSSVNRSHSLKAALTLEKGTLTESHRA